jgi:hypothetical protein
MILAKGFLIPNPPKSFHPIVNGVRLASIVGIEHFGFCATGSLTRLSLSLL